ncbi:delta 1-pyrroline-5-carboxylate synthetase [Caballeronia glathei]|uniref:Aspartate kinase n=1 Tax=Caballeronia glathei TaxID=60547 RepID=A0A069PU65_9BURK|nr:MULTISPECIES: aspartate kinase [Burkholderiaceae]KDR43987.1 aspartate kinase [Caballeronia glathei]TCK38611.1 amino acid kinase family protein [Paraburkholderia sp. BL8N3]CDY74339.1 delta 1-pyrroline-5-carboxylate synthetase [Caballeronia glathei]
MWVVKIGGSLSHDPALREWLTQLWEVGGGRVVIVPGGGDFADTVRQYQREWRFNDVAAHNMCLLAMAQYAILMQGVLPELVLASNEQRIRRALRDGRVAVWVPTELMRVTPDPMTNWDTTSDSLAAWLSATLNAERLMVVKSCAVDAGTPLEALASNGVIDPRFLSYVKEANYVVELFNKSDVALMRDRLLNMPVV